MMTRVIEIKTKPGKARELCRRLHEDVLGILQSHPGFIDEIVLLAEHDPDQVVAITFWKTKSDAEDFEGREFKHISDTIQHLAHTQANVGLYAVDTSTAHNFLNGRLSEPEVVNF